jgi:hypothetical protein
MKYAADTGSGAMIYIRNFIQIGSTIQKLIRGVHRQTHSIFLQNRQSRLTRNSGERLSFLQNKVLRGIVNAPWYARNSDIHRVLGIRMVTAGQPRRTKIGFTNTPTWKRHSFLTTRGQ